MGPGLGAGPMTISPIYNSQLYILRYTTKAKVTNEPFCQTRKINIRIKFYLFCRTHAFKHHRYIVEFYITKLSIQCSLPMCRVIARVLHFGPPDVIRTASICLKRNGVNQLWYFICFSLFLLFCPDGFLTFSLNFAFRK